MSLATCSGCGRTMTSSGLPLHQRKCGAWKALYAQLQRGVLPARVQPRVLRQFHMGVTKDYLIKVIRTRDDWREFLQGDVPRLGTDAEQREEAIAELMKDSRTVFCSCACRKDADGSCSGVPEPEAKEG